MKIGIYRALFLGDMLCAIPTVRAVRAAFPDASVTLIGLPWQTDLVKRFTRYFTGFIEFGGWPGVPEKSADASTALAFARQMQDEAFDLVLQMQGNGESSNIMCTLWDARKLCGLRKAGEFCPDEKLFPVSDDADNEILRFLKLADALDIPRRGTHLELPALPAELERYSAMCASVGLDGRPYICIHPGSKDPKRRWPAENFASAANHFSNLGFTVVLTGAAPEAELLAGLESNITGRVINAHKVAGGLSLGELALFIGNASLLISNDTGVSHIAAALRTPSVIVFSKYSNPSRWAPLDRSLHVVVPYDGPQTPGVVIAAAERQLGRYRTQVSTLSSLSEKNP